MGNFWLVSWSNVFKSWHLIGCQQPQKHLPIIVHTAWVTVFNLFKYLNDLQSQTKIISSDLYGIPLMLIFFMDHLLVKILRNNYSKDDFLRFL